MHNPRQSFLAGFFIAIISVGLFVAVPIFFGDVPDVFAQALKGDEFFGGKGTSGTSFAQSLGLSPGPSIQVMIARIIRTVIGFVGIIVVVMIIYGGFLYMTSGGNATRLEKAKKIIIQSIIGLVIVLTSFTIVHFIIGRLVEATGGGITSGTDEGAGTYPDGGVFSSFHLLPVNTKCAETLRNFQLQFVFSKNVNALTVQEAISVKKITGEYVKGTFETNGSVVTFTPTAACPEPNASVKCFDANTKHDITIIAGVLKSTSGSALTCSIEFPCQYSFMTGMGVDLTSPKVTMNAPTDGGSVIVGDIVELKALTNDDTGISSVDFFVLDDDQPIYSSGIGVQTAQGVLFSTDPNVEWNTAGYVTNKSYPIWAKTSDCAGNTATAGKIFASVLAANCDNKVKDENLGETDIDCGGDPNSEFYCKKCDEEVCTNNSDCASGVCENSICVTKPRIDMVSPGDGAVGNLVTISGKGFEDYGGSVTFIGKKDSKSIQVNAYQCGTLDTWTDKQIIVQVPQEATDGPLEITTAAPDAKKDRTDDLYGPLSADFDVNAIKRPGLCAVDPLSQKPGFSALFYGLGFGKKSDSSTVYFKDSIAASYPFWSDAQVTAVVPNINAGSVKTQMFTGDYRCIDVTGKELGQLCVEDKDCGEGNTCARSWCSETLAYCASNPACGDVGGTCSSVRVGSNKISFTIEDTTPDASAPVISYVDSGWKACKGGANNGQRCAKKEDCDDGECELAQNWGPVGQYVTIYGTGFGTVVGQVWFYWGHGKNALGDTDFPDQCGDDFWSDTSITVKVPSAYQSVGKQNVGEKIIFGAHQLSVKKGAQGSNSVDFVVVNDSPGPAICKIDPAAGPANTQTTLYGENLSSQKGTVTFFDQQQANYLFWESKKVTDVVVPEQAKTGPVFATTQAGYTTNSVNFSVGNCQEDFSCPVNEKCCNDGSCRKECQAEQKAAHFAYKISTGIIPEPPIVEKKCDADVKSPTPWESWPDSKAICLNASVSATFSKPMNGTSFAGRVVVEACPDFKDGKCAAWKELMGVLESSATSFNWDGDDDFAPNTRHRVTILGGDGGVRAAASEGGAFMVEDYSWEFMTSGANAFCKIGGVLVTPSAFTATEQDNPADPKDGIPYLADILASGYQCVKMSCKDQSIAWSSNFAGAEIDDPESALCAQQVNALSETQSQPAKIKATVTNADLSPTDTGDLTINFSDPAVAAFFPNCQTACVNTKPWARFDVKMDEASLKQGVKIYECVNALCAKEELVNAEIIQDVTYDPETKTMFVKTTKSIKPNKWYRVVLSGTIVKSASHVLLKNSGSNFGSAQNPYFKGDFSWKFKTKNSDLLCAIDSIAVSPQTKILTAVKERQAYTATAYNAPDDCDGSGQALQDAEYTWQAWKAADKAPEKNPASSQDIAFLLKKGAIKRASTLPAWCSPLCLNTGTSVTNTQALCGDGFVNGPGKKTAEECDGGNGCSTSCLWQGTSACPQDNGANCCGNKIVETAEQCDDGGQIDGGGCSAKCLNEGSASVGAVCGDSVVDHVPQTGGEDCDDGNTKNSDGCSAQCLFEGSLSFENTFAVCGNGIVEKGKGEDCDGGVGCDSTCLHKGTSVCAFVCSDTKETCLTKFDCKAPATCEPAKTPCCGNGGPPENGEDCDDGKTVSGDGCSSQCLKEGSSIAYEPATVCGDAVIGLGEECDAKTGQTLAIGGFAVAQINDKVYKEVETGGGYAVSIITATAENVTGTGSLQIDCSCQTDQACGAPTTIGCGAGSCCFPRPDAVEFEPVGDGPGEKGFCRNTTVRVKFDQKMDPKSFSAVDKNGNGQIEQTEVANIRLELDVGDSNETQNDQQICPTDYLFVQSTPSNGNIFARVWDWIKRKAHSFFGTEVFAGKICVAPVTYKVVDAKDGQLVYLQLSKPLEANATYRLRVIGDKNDKDGISEGVQSENGVVACFGDKCSVGSKFSEFKTGKEICLLESVSIEDMEKIGAEPYEPPSPQFFSKIKEEHKFVSQAFTYRDGLGVYEPISETDIYKWTWEWSSAIAKDAADNIVDGAPQEDLKKTGSDANFVAVGNNGQEYVVSTATISVDTLNNPTTKGTEKGTVEGKLEVTAFMCENPWPVPDPVTGWKPYIEKIDPAKPSNFGFYYCMDRGADDTDDLPELDAPIDVTSADIESLLQEILFKVQGTPDAIGARVFQNPDYLSPKDWFESQKFTGGYTEIVMDGYEGVQSGNTAYVAAANEHGAVLYPNIYVVSYNPNAGADAKEIFAQILENWRFNANTDVVSNVGLCKIGDEHVKNEAGDYVNCKWDGECVDGMTGAVCDNDKAKLQRDMKRLLDVKSQMETLNAYGSTHKHCSVTKTQSCSGNEGCPGTEKCVEGYPTIQQGTFVPSLSVSKWNSWNAEFSNQIGTAMPSDPINEFWQQCKKVVEDPEQQKNYDPATCFNGLEGKFICPDRSHVYGYQSQGGEAYKLYAKLEYTGAPWAFAIDQSLDDDAKVVAEYDAGQAPAGLLANSGFVSSPQFCSDSKAWGVSSVCGDGVVEQDEECELGEIKVIDCVEQVDGKQVSGKMNATCLFDLSEPVTACQAFQDLEQAKKAGSVCVPNKCGNGILENGEKCDDGTLNGAYGHCGSSCAFDDAFLCGDGYLAGGEECDCGDTIHRSGKNAVQKQTGSWANQNQDPTCQVANGQYGEVKKWSGTEKFVSCSYDCKLSGPSCGDKQINGTEECDGELETSVSNCPVSKVCVGGKNAGLACPHNPCGTGKCSDFSYQLSRTRVCSTKCAWPDNWLACKGGDQQCGNGSKEGSEECDDGNQSNNDSCAIGCKTNICGDNFVFTGVESCDNGELNILPNAQDTCAAPYGGDCNYCNTLCQYKTASGAYCGDGKINGTELCDGVERSYYCFDTGNGMEQKGTCAKANANKVGVDYGCEDGFTCRDVGVCNGGSQNGQPCTTGEGEDTASCPDGQCVFPVCASDCSSTCPSTFKQTSILVQSELPDAQPIQSVELYSFFNKENLSPDSAVLHIPACKVGTKITANVSSSQVAKPYVDVIFVTDLSTSMMEGIGDGKSKIQIVTEATIEAITNLFNAYGGSNSEKMQIGLVSFGPKDDPNTPEDEGITAVLNSPLVSNTPENKQKLKAIVKDYPNHADGWTPTGRGIKLAIETLGPAGADHLKYVILLSDGQVNYSLNGTSCDTMNNDVDITTEAGVQKFSKGDYCVAEARYSQDMIYDRTEQGNYFFYSASIGNSPDWIAYLEHLSSMKCQGISMGVGDDCAEGEFAFQTSTAEGIKEMYQKIVKSILSSTITVSAIKDGIVQSATEITEVGNNINIPIPTTFQCQDKPFMMPIKTSFYGIGTMKFDNFTFTYCPVQ
jgi:cysteine-rich repeat protein